MPKQNTFKRYELKYMLTKEQKERVLEAIRPYMSLDKYGLVSIKNIYYDTPSYRLIRRSIEKPDYKEKIRIRGYGEIGEDSQVFVEIKKKYNKVVYKRRISLPRDKAVDWISGTIPKPVEGQIANEIEYLINYYGDIGPVLYLSYEREAYYQRDGGDFRVTFDNKVCCREREFSFDSSENDLKLLEDDKVLMELKCSGGIPLWMTEILSKEKLYKTSFSKYGTAYQRIIYPKMKGEKVNG